MFVTPSKRQIKTHEKSEQLNQTAKYKTNLEEKNARLGSGKGRRKLTCHFWC